MKVLLSCSSAEVLTQLYNRFRECIYINEDRLYSTADTSM